MCSIPARRCGQGRSAVLLHITISIRKIVCSIVGIDMTENIGESLPPRFLSGLGNMWCKRMEVY
jgi:hypothetical protein